MTQSGTVQELLVHDGDHVRAGQALIRMNDAQASATAETAKAQRWTLLAQLARLDSETAGDSSSRSCWPPPAGEVSMRRERPMRRACNARFSRRAPSA
jgi:multidrug efflux pump subunit AcrA (membrane-fusion protein)